MDLLDEYSKVLREPRRLYLSEGDTVIYIEDDWETNSVIYTMTKILSFTDKHGYIDRVELAAQWDVSQKFLVSQDYLPGELAESIKSRLSPRLNEKISEIIKVKSGLGYTVVKESYDGFTAGIQGDVVQASPSYNIRC